MLDHPSITRFFISKNGYKLDIGTFTSTLLNTIETSLVNDFLVDRKLLLNFLVGNPHFDHPFVNFIVGCSYVNHSHANDILSDGPPCDHSG